MRRGAARARAAGWRGVAWCGAAGICACLERVQEPYCGELRKRKRIRQGLEGTVPALSSDRGWASLDTTHHAPLPTSPLCLARGWLGDAPRQRDVAHGPHGASSAKGADFVESDRRLGPLCGCALGQPTCALLQLSEVLGALDIAEGDGRRSHPVELGFVEVQRLQQRQQPERARFNLCRRRLRRLYLCCRCLPLRFRRLPGALVMSLYGTEVSDHAG